MDKPDKLTPAEYKRLVQGESGGRMVYGIDLRNMRRMGLSPAEAVQYAEKHKLFHRGEKVQSGRPKEIGVKKKRGLSHYTVMTRLADANAEICRKLLKHRMSEKDLAMVRKIKDDAEAVILRSRESFEQNDA